MFTLNPGPSQISPETKADIATAVRDGILELSHRSSRFTEISRLCIEELRAYLNVPPEYRIFYFDSATQIWHSLAANLVADTSFHFINGSFSAKAREASAALGKTALTNETAWGDQNDFATARIPREAEIITACYNETSTGVKMIDSEVRLLREKYPEKILAIDITSCAGGVPVPIHEADVWYFSVQKCFGLPAGLGIAVISPRAYERAEELSKTGRNTAGIWAWPQLEKMMANDVFQTPHTPNVLNIYLLGAQCQRWNKNGGMNIISETTIAKKKEIEDWMVGRNGGAFFVQDTAHRSDTVLTIGASPELITNAKELCRERGITLGSGYGSIKRDTFRIANFPAVTRDMIAQTLTTLEEIFN